MAPTVEFGLHQPPCIVFTESVVDSNEPEIFSFYKRYEKPDFPLSSVKSHRSYEVGNIPDESI